MTTQQIAQKYFELSNRSDFAGITKLCARDLRYKSENTGEYEGIKNVIKMQQTFHKKFMKLEWTINDIEPISSNEVVVHYHFSATNIEGQHLESAGLEYIQTKAGKIVKISIKNQ